MEVRTYWIAGLLSIMPTAKPFTAGKQVTTQGFYLRGYTIVYTHRGLVVSVSFATELCLDRLALNVELGISAIGAIGAIENLNMLPTAMGEYTISIV